MRQESAANQRPARPDGHFASGRACPLPVQGWYFLTSSYQCPREMPATPAARRASPALTVMTRRTYSSSARDFHSLRLGRSPLPPTIAAVPARPSSTWAAGSVRAGAARAPGFAPGHGLPGAGPRPPASGWADARAGSDPPPRRQGRPAPGRGSAPARCRPGIFHQHVQHRLGQGLFRQIVAQAEGGDGLAGPGPGFRRASRAAAGSQW